MKKLTVVELVEMVARSEEGTVEGAGPTSAKLPKKTKRSDKNGAAFKQYINIDKDVEGAAKRHPEYARYVELRARVECPGDTPSGKTVKFRFDLEKGTDRPAALAATAKEGFGSSGGAETATESTDSDGWTGTIKFYLSQYGGDKFKIYAQGLDDQGKVVGSEKTIGTYEVWRKFWYQITRAENHAVAAPTKSGAAYEKVFAEMLATAEVKFKEADSPARTFYPGWMVRSGGGDDKESVIGGHNREKFYDKFKEEKDKPVKVHLIICQNQWDPFDTSALKTFVLNKTPSDELPIDLGGAFNAGIVKPALSGDLIELGKWSGNGESGDLTDGNILIEKGRAGFNVVKVTLPAGAPDPTKHPITIKLKLRYGKFYAGESNHHQMLIKYDGSEPKFNQTVSHEFGHGFNQTPRPGNEPPPLAKHPKQYTNEHGGVGSHCSTDATLVTDAAYPKKRYSDGTCIMFHQLNPGGCKQVFCSTCEPYLKLQDFSAIK